MKVILAVLLFSLGALADYNHLLSQTSEWLERSPELSELGLPPAPTVRRQFEERLQLHMEELARQEAGYGGLKSKHWLDWEASDALVKLGAFTSYYDHLGGLLELILVRPQLTGLMQESTRSENSLALALWKLWEDWNFQSFRSVELPGRDYIHLFNNPGPSMSDLVFFKREFLSVIRDEFNKNAFDKLINGYEQKSKTLKRLAQNVPGRLWTHRLYDIKSSLLRFFGRLALPNRNTIDPYEMTGLQDILRPGDIMVANQDGRLSNVIFKGTWTHGILYVGPPAQLERYFMEAETIEFYQQKCASLGMNCRDFPQFLQERYPDQTREYFNSASKSHPRLIIEGIDRGVVSNSFFTMKRANRIAAFAPKLSPLERARALEVAFSNIGKPYDYNFDARSYDRLVCTELIIYSYLADPATQKSGLNFSLNFVRGAVSMYAYNIVEAFFNYGEMEFRAYWESPRSGGRLEKLGPEELAETI